MEHDFLEAEVDSKHEFSSMRDDVKNKNLEEKHALRIQLEGTVEDLWRQFQAVRTSFQLSQRALTKCILGPESVQCLDRRAEKAIRGSQAKGPKKRQGNRGTNEKARQTPRNHFTSSHQID